MECLNGKKFRSITVEARTSEDIPESEALTVERVVFIPAVAVWGGWGNPATSQSNESISCESGRGQMKPSKNMSYKRQKGVTKGQT